MIKQYQFNSNINSNSLRAIYLSNLGNYLISSTLFLPPKDKKGEERKKRKEKKRKEKKRKTETKLKTPEERVSIDDSFRKGQGDLFERKTTEKQQRKKNPPKQKGKPRRMDGWMGIIDEDEKGGLKVRWKSIIIEVHA